jgi:hypothetical protein
VNIGRKFLEEQAVFFASKLQCSEEKAIHAIIKSEESKKIYRNIKELLGKEPSSLTQIDILDPSSCTTDQMTTLTSKSEVEQHIMQRNHRHSTIDSNSFHKSF